MATVLPLIPPDSDAIDFERRFGGIARLYGESALTSFKQAHVCVIGVGGVGSWAVEGLARSAIGKITMIDLDHLSESNINRQLHALTDTLGQSKVDALAERIAQINPYCVVTRVEEFIDPDNVATLIPVGQFDYVIDAIDNTRAKTALVVHCRANHIPLVTIGSAGGQVDPTRIAVCDLSRTEQEPLLARVRKRLRRLHGFPRGTKNKFGIDAVYSTEPVRHPELCVTDDETSEASNEGLNGLNCAGYGSAVVVTASFGFVAAGLVLRKLAEKVN
ncbi:MAG: tRNA cyclic N6-threonylcarbamoyladenosine(37) synthase TcdA [Sulfuritalea sp.]|nr:tRNA cyclic N6-threonylcarbamoyladenosine(37) synthase TcdA [Polynucleobacter sp.]MCF8188542.1 tRNA cyclic N6-threonylcarbamoyladenosine(37) synthase TcdA [Sulfuritalea sp.]